MGARLAWKKARFEGRASERRAPIASSQAQEVKIPVVVDVAHARREIRGHRGRGVGRGRGRRMHPAGALVA